MEFDKVKKHTEEKIIFDTGAQREVKTGKGRYDLLPPIAIKRLARHYENGAKVHSDRNWEKGLPLHSFADSMIRHAFAVLEGKRDEDHLAAVMWNAAGYIYTEDKIINGELSGELNTMPFELPMKIKSGVGCARSLESLGNDFDEKLKNDLEENGIISKGVCSFNSKE